MLIDTTSEAERKAQERMQREARNRWHAVTVAAPANACAAALACRGQRFLSPEAPLLPLEGCDSPRCRCKYRHFEDRRLETRRDEHGGGGRVRSEGERRKKGGRRSTD